MKKYKYIILFAALLPINLFAQAPANDNCINASEIVISNNGFGLGTFNSTTIDITDATIQLTEVFHNSQISAGNDKKTVWFSFYLPTARAVNLELLQPTELIAQNGAGFTVYKTDNCLPALDDITDAKLTPVNKFGSTYNPCLLPGNYLVQVSAQENSDGEIYLELTTNDPQVTSDYFSQATAYNFGTISGGWHTLNFDAGCQTIQDENEVCPELGANYLEYTQSAWFVFTTDNAIDLLTLRIAEQNGFFTGNFRFAYNIYEGDVRLNDYSTLTLIDGCNVMHQTSSSVVPSRNYLCDFSPYTTYSIQIFFHSEYMNSIYVQLFERGDGQTISPNPSSINASSQLGLLPSSVAGEWSYGYDQFACNAFISDNTCGTVNPGSGSISFGGTTYELSTFYTFSIDDYMNVRFSTNGYLGKRLFFGDISTDCNLISIQEFTSGDITFNCLEPGTYSVQMLGKIDTSQNYVNSNYNHIGYDANLSLLVINNSISADFLLDATDHIDFVNKPAAVWEPLPDDIQITASTGRLNCEQTVLPAGQTCGASLDRAMYREVIIGDSDGDAIEDSGVLTVGSGNYYLNYLFYRESANELATAQGAFDWGETITGMEQLMSCTNLYYSQKICVEPGKYTLVSFGDVSDVGRSDAPTFKFKQYNTLFDNPSVPDNLGDISTALMTSSVQGTPDYFSCNDNPLTIAAKDPCSDATKQIYRQFYIDQEMILNISQSGGTSFRLFYGKISDGVSTLTANIPAIGDIGCRSSYNTNVCNPLPAGWYTIVVYGVGASYTGPVYSGGVIGNQTNINISRVEPLDPTNYHAPALAYDAGICDWGPNAGSTAIPQNSKTYTFGTERFNCIDNLPLLVEECSGFNRQAFYVFEITQESYLSITGIPSTMKAAIFDADVRTDYASFPTMTPIQECINISGIGSYDRWWWYWGGKIDMCIMQPGVYTLIVYASDSHINQTVTPSLYVDNVGSSRFDFAENAYDFGLIPDDNNYYLGKVGDTNPLDPSRAPSNDFFYCSTGAFPNDPGQSDAIGYCWDGMYPVAGTPSVDYPMDPNYTQYTTTTNAPPRRNLWYSFVIDGPGIVSVKVENKTPGKTTQNPFAIYLSDESGDIDFADLVASGDVDSTLAQGLTFIDNNSTFDYYGCAGNQQTISFNIDPCDNPGKQRFYVVVDQHVGLIPNSQIEVSVKHEDLISLESKYNYFIEANLINGLNEEDPPYSNIALTDGIFEGDMSSFACATKAITDQNTCGQRTLWYKFTSDVSGTLRIQYEIEGVESTYNNSDMMLFRELIADDSTSTGLDQLTTSVVNISGEAWGETCLNIGTYYIMLTGCSYTIENVLPRIWLIAEDGDNCEQAVAIEMSSLGTQSANVEIDCHSIGDSFGEDGSNMGCLLGPEGYKSTWFRVDLNFTEKADITYQLSENTTALPSQIRYRVLYGSCGSMTAGPCNTDALTEFTLNCMLSENSSYYVQVVMPENATGDISLTVTAVESPSEFCVPFNPLLPIANFTYENTCLGDQTCFTNQSTMGSSVTYLWDFDINDPGSINSTEINPCYQYPAAGTYQAQLTVTSTILDPEGNPYNVSSTVTIPVTIYPKPDQDISRIPADYEVVSGVSVDYFSNNTQTIADPATTYDWDLANGTSNDVNPAGIVYDLSNLGYNLISLTVTNGTCAVTDTDSIFVGYEPIYNGGNFDGEAFAVIEGNCPVENIFAGGFYDGESSAIIEGNCPVESIFAGGFYDGEDIAVIEGNCPVESIFAGGNYDGEAMSHILGTCPIENIFGGGLFDGEDMCWVISDVIFDSGSQTVCSGDEIVISVTDNNDPAYQIDSIRWYNGFTTYISTSFSPDLDLAYTITSSTTIYARVYSPRFCDSAMIAFSYAVFDSPVADAGEDEQICIGENVQIGTASSNPLFTYEWTPAASLDDSNIPQPNASPDITTVYTLSVYNYTSGCPAATDNVTVTVDTDKPVISVDDEVICNNAAAELVVTGFELSDDISWFEVGNGSALTAVMPSLLDANITASSQYDGNHASYKARLNATYDPNWSAATNNTSQWIKVNCGAIIPIGAIATQGRYGYDQWVTSYKVSYSNDDSNWTFVGGSDLSSATTFTGNSDRHTIITTEFTTAINAQYIRIHPATWSGHISMRIEVYKVTTLSTTETLSVTNEGQYFVEVSRGGCVSRDTAQAIAITYPAGANVSVCDLGGDDVIGIPTISSATYSWSPATELSATNIAQPTATPTQNHTYSVTVTHPAGTCIDEVNVFGPISINAGADIEICPPLGVEVTPTYTGTISTWEWNDEGPEKKLPVIINNPNSSLNDYQVMFTLNTSSLITDGKMRTDCGDLRVYDSDETTLLDYWIVDGTCNSTNTQIWVKIPSLPENDKTIYAHYGNSALTSQSNGNNVFEFFDDFNSATYDNTKWTSPQGTISQSSGVLTLSANGGLIASSYTIPSNTIWESLAMTPSTTYGSALRGATTTTTGYVNDGGANILDILWYGSSFYWETNSGETYAGGGWTTNTFDKYKIIYRPNNTDIAYFDYNNGTRTGNRTGTNATGTLKPVLYSSSSANWDWLLIRKYASIDPSISFGSEQAASVIATTQSYTIDQPGTYYVTASGGDCTDSDTIIATNAVLNTDLLAWRTRNSGNWDNTTIWQVYNGSIWVNAESYTDVCGNVVTYPDYQDSTILIRSGHQVDFNQSLAIDELNIEAGAILEILTGLQFQMVDSSSSAIVPDLLNNGQIIIEAGGELAGIGLAQLQNNGRIDISGVFNVLGGASPKLINSHTSTVAYNNGNQNLWNGTYGRLEVNGSGLKTVVGTVSKASNEVEFISGKILLGNRNFTMMQNAIISGASFATGYFITDNNGTLIKENLGAVGAESFTYHVGSSETSYNPAWLQNSGSADNIRCRVVENFEFEAAFPNDELSEISSVDRTWFISEDITGDSDITINLSWITSHENAEFNSSECQIGSYNATTGWMRLGASGAASGAGVYVDLHSYQTNGIADLYAFTLGSCSLAPDEYRTIANGNWTDINIWEVFDGVNWISPQFFPTSCGEITYPTSNSNTILVRHNITYDFSISQGIDQTTLESQAKLTVPAGINLHVANGTGYDIINQGEIIISGTATSVSGFTIDSQTESVFNYNGDNQDILDCTYAILKIDGTLPDAGRIKTVVGSNTIVNQRLEFINGKILLNNNLQLGLNTTIINPGQNTGYVIATSNGYLIWNFNAGSNTSRLFPVGGIYYSPALLTFNQINAPGTMLCRVRETIHPNNPNSIKRYWNFEKGSIVFTGFYDMSLTYNDNDLPYTPTNIAEEMQMVELAGAYNPVYPTADNWIYSDNGIDYFVSTTSNYASLTHNQFSDFTLMSKNNPLPVNLLYITAKWNNNDGVIEWATGSEINNKGFEIQRCSGNCESFQTIGFVEGKGNSNTPKQYKFIDEDLIFDDDNNFYYRLKQIDFDDQYKYSPIVSLSKEEKEIESEPCPEIIIYPNPLNIGSKLSVYLSSDINQLINITIYDLLGKEILTTEVSVKAGANLFEISTDILKSGAYFLVVDHKDCSTTQRFIVMED